MVYHWGSGLRPLSGILNVRKHFSETGSVSTFRCGGKGRGGGDTLLNRTTLQQYNRVCASKRILLHKFDDLIMP
jgi:hypothetical protein